MKKPRPIPRLFHERLEDDLLRLAHVVFLHLVLLHIRFLFLFRFLLGHLLFFLHFLLVRLAGVRSSSILGEGERRHREAESDGKQQREQFLHEIQLSLIVLDIPGRTTFPIDKPAIGECSGGKELYDKNQPSPK